MTSRTRKRLSKPDGDPFFVGTAISTFQNSGDPNCNWGAWEKQRKFCYLMPTINGDQVRHVLWGLRTGRKHIPNAILPKRIGVSCDFWHNYEQHIALAAGLGSNAFRFSLEWSRIMPTPDSIDHDAVAQFHRIFDCCKKHKLEPFVTLHHYTHPQWFEELGGFVKQENIKLFVDWCMFAFSQFGSKARFWATLNEPNVQSLCGFVLGLHPPGYLLNFRDCGLNLLHLLQAHAAVYDAIKATQRGQEVQVGIVHNVAWIEPKYDNVFNTHVRLVCVLANFVQGTRQVMQFLKTGRFEWKLPFGRSVIYQHPRGKPGLDYIGLNCYTRPVVSPFCTPTTKGPGEIMVDFDWPICPSALYAGIACVAELGLPVYITENGCPDKLDDERRTMWINTYMQQVEKAVADGIDVRGFLYWTLVDNFEWNFGYNLKFGLHSFSRSDPSDVTLREGAKVISQHFRDLPTKLQERIAANSVLRIHYKQQYMEQLPVVVYDWKGILHVEKKALQLLTEEADDYEVAGRLLQAHTC